MDEPEPGPPELEAEVVHLDGGSIDTVEGELVRITQGGVNRVVAGQAELQVVAAAIIDSDTLEMDRSAALLVRGNLVSAEESAAVAVLAEEARLVGSTAGLAIAGSVEMNNSSALVLLAREVHGPVDVILDTRGALLAGMVSGVVIGLVLFAGNLLARRRMK